MRKSPLEEGRRWLEQAESDLRWAKLLAGAGGYDVACFLSQQVAEKAIKAFLYAQGEELVFSHAVERLCDAASRYDTAFTQFADRWSFLDIYYISARYPNSVPDSIPAMVFTQDTALGAVSAAGEVVAAVGERLTHMGEERG